MLRVEIADTPSKQQQGLMMRNKLADDAGMLFVFKKPQKLSFWGLNTYIPLDIAFIDENNRISQISDIKPLCTKFVHSRDSCSMALEANLGYFESKRIRVGDKIKLNKLDDIISFERSDISKVSQVSKDELKQKSIDDSNIEQYLEDNFDEETGEQEQTQVIPNPAEPTDVSPIDVNPIDEKKVPDVLPDIPVPDKPYPKFEDEEKASDWGSENRESMRINYVTKRGRNIQRDIEPHGIFTARSTGNNILVSWDNTVNDIRAFIVDNIIHYQFIGSKFEPKFMINPVDNIRTVEKPQKTDNKGIKLNPMKDTTGFT